MVGRQPSSRRARLALERGGVLALLLAPTVIAFFAGGYFELEREWAGLFAWALVALSLALRPGGSGLVPRRLGGRLALVGLSLLALWTLVSFLWAPIKGDAYQAGQMVFVYVGVLAAASMLLRVRGAPAAVEPALAAGALVVVGYGISERLLPGLLHFARSASAQGRLEQPLTYWNAMGELAALGFVLCARLAGDASRPQTLRAGAAAACAPIGLGLYISFSRGALAACLAGLLTLAVLAPQREQLNGLLASILAGTLAALVAAPLHGVTALAGGTATRERQGALMLVALVVIAAGAGGLMLALTRRPRPGTIRLPRHKGLIASAVVCAGLAAAIVVGASEHGGRPLSAGATRLVTLQSNRYAYWRVALRAFRDEPLRGVGAGGWAVYWLRHRPFNEFAKDAHSLPLQTAAELGLVGLLLLTAFVGGVALAARDAYRDAPSLASGAIAALVAYAVHAPLDWDWQMPAVTMVALVLAGVVIVLAEPDRCAQSSSATRGASRLKIQTADAQMTR
jgi:hypothetical protein